MAGELDVERLLRRLTAKQFVGWQIYETVEPFGDMRADFHAAQIAQMVFNMAVEPRHRKEMGEFLLRFKTTDEQVKAEERQPQTFEEQIAIAKIMAEAAAKLHKEKSPDR